MSQDCIFCKIVADEIPGRKVFEDDEVLAFLDANPLAEGHTLVIPKDHYETLDEVPEETAARVFGVLHELNSVVQNAVDADGANVAFNDGKAAGQEVPHVHGHIIPRFDSDGGHPIHAVAGERPNLSDEELDKIAGAIHDGS